MLAIPIIAPNINLSIFAQTFTNTNKVCPFCVCLYEHKDYMKQKPWCLISKNYNWKEQFWSNQEKLNIWGQLYHGSLFSTIKEHFPG